MALDGIEVSLDTARQLAEDLRASGHWTFHTGYERLYEAWYQGQPIMFRDQADT
jgi:hypothetical protein